MNYSSEGNALILAHLWMIWLDLSLILSSKRKNKENEDDNEHMVLWWIIGMGGTGIVDRHVQLWGAQGG